MNKTLDFSERFGGFWKKGLAREFHFEVPTFDNPDFNKTLWQVYSRGIWFVSAVRLIAEGNKNAKWLNQFADNYEKYLIPFGCATIKENATQNLQKVIRGDFAQTYPDATFIRTLFFDAAPKGLGYSEQAAIKRGMEQIKWINKPRPKGEKNKTKYLPKICISTTPPAENLDEIYKGGEITPENSFTIKGLTKAGKLFFLYICICLQKDWQLKQYVETDRVFDVSEYLLEAFTGVARMHIKGLQDAVKGMVSKNLLFQCPTPTGMGWFATPVIIIDPNLNLKKTGGKITRVRISKDFITNPQVKTMLTRYFNIEYLTGLTLQEILKGAQDLNTILSLFPVLETWYKKGLAPISYKSFIMLNGYQDNSDTKKKIRRAAAKLNQKVSFERGGDWVWEHANPAQKEGN